MASFFFGATRPLRTSCEVVGIRRGDASSARARVWRQRRAGARTGAGIIAEATITSTKASACSVTPSGLPAIGSPNTMMPPAMPAMFAAVPVTAITGTASPSCRPRAEA